MKGILITNKLLCLSSAPKFWQCTNVSLKDATSTQVDTLQGPYMLGQKEHYGLASFWCTFSVTPELDQAFNPSDLAKFCKCVLFFFFKKKPQNKNLS